ncbi:MAG: aromatic ring-hydroxylating dioxygenase subunit alpha, partial [Betaproteobacteria bacterium]
LAAIDAVQAGGTPPMVLDAAAAAALTGPVTIDCIAPAQGWEAHWADKARALREAAPWLAAPSRAAAAPA